MEIKEWRYRERTIQRPVTTHTKTLRAELYTVSRSEQSNDSSAPSSLSLSLALCCQIQNLPLVSHSDQAGPGWQYWDEIKIKAGEGWDTVFRKIFQYCWCHCVFHYWECFTNLTRCSATSACLQFKFWRFSDARISIIINNLKLENPQSCRPGQKCIFLS